MIGLAAGVAVATIAADAQAQFGADWSAVGKALGKSGMVQKAGVYRVGFPRTDLKVSLDGVVLRPGFALGGWVGFMPMSQQAMAMGDLVLTEDEIPR